MLRLVYNADRFITLIDELKSKTWTKQTVEEFETKELALKRIDELNLKIIEYDITLTGDSILTKKISDSNGLHPAHRELYNDTKQAETTS